MRKILVGVACLMALMLTVSADVIVEPEDNFYETHREECIYVSKMAYVATNGERVKCYAAPDSPQVVSQIDNGEKIYIGWQWGTWYYNEQGWLHSSELVFPYDHDDFCQDHETVDVEEMKLSAPVAQLYTYPNSGESQQMEEDPQYATFGESISKTYTDKDGRQWGYIGYYMAWDGWICLDDPTNPNLDSGAVPLGQSESQVTGEVYVPQGVNYLWIATGGVVLVMGVTAFLLLRKKRK